MPPPLPPPSGPVPPAISWRRLSIRSWGELARRQVCSIFVRQRRNNRRRGGTVYWRCRQRWAGRRAIGGVLLEYPMLRLGRRIDAVILTDRAIVVLEFKREQADVKMRCGRWRITGSNLFDFHEYSRAHPVVPLLVSGRGAGQRASDAADLGGVWHRCGRRGRRIWGGNWRRSFARLARLRGALDARGVAWRRVPAGADHYRGGVHVVCAQWRGRYCRGAGGSAQFARHDASDTRGAGYGARGATAGDFYS